MSKDTNISQDDIITPIMDEIAVINNDCFIKDIDTPIASYNELLQDIQKEKKGSINDNIIELPLPHLVPEFTEDFIGRINKEKFKGGELTFFLYPNSQGVFKGCVVRCDFKEGDKKKQFAQYSYNPISKKWQSGWSEPQKPLYNLLEIIASPDKPVMIVEGEKVVEKAKILFPEFVLTTSCMGAQSARSSNWSVLKGRDVIIAPDNDTNGAKYARTINDILKVEEAKTINGFDSKKLGRFTIVDGKPTRRKELVPDKYDLADAAADGWTAALIEEWKNHADFSPFFQAVSDVQVIRQLPKEGEEPFFIAGVNYKLNKNNNSLWYESVTTDGRTKETVATWVKLSGYMKPTHCTVDVNGNHGLLVEITTRRNRTVECFFAREEMATEKDTTKLLLAKGLSIPHLRPANCYALNSYLNNFEPKFKAVGVDTVGWQKDLVTYILPFADASRNSYSSVKEDESKLEYIFQQQGIITNSLKRKGVLAEWKRTVGEVCRSNHLHSFAILAALAAPSIKLLDEEGGVFHYAGNTSIGKSTILNVAKSVWGYEKLNSLRITDNALESICKNANDGAVFFDEIGEMEPEALDRAIYMLGNGATKGRSDRSGNVKPITHFTVLAQMSGEIGLESKLAEKNRQAKGGQLIRMIELDADRGKGFVTFDVLNINPDTGERFSSGREQAEYLKTHLSQNYGIIIDNFLIEVVKDIEGFIAGLKESKAKWFEDKFESKKMGQEVARVAKRFSTIYANGIAAVAFGIIPHSFKEIEECINVMFDNWLEKFGGEGSYELKTMIDNLSKLCIEQQYSRFCDAQPHSDDKVILPRDKAGYWKKTLAEIRSETGIIRENVISEFWIYPKVFEREILKGKDKKVFYRLLADKGYVKKEDANQYDSRRTPAKEKRQRFIVINVATLLDKS